MYFRKKTAAAVCIFALFLIAFSGGCSVAGTPTNPSEAGDVLKKGKNYTLTCTEPNMVASNTNGVIVRERAAGETTAVLKRDGAKYHVRYTSYEDDPNDITQEERCAQKSGGIYRFYTQLDGEWYWHDETYANDAEAELALNNELDKFFKTSNYDRDGDTYTFQRGKMAADDEFSSATFVFGHAAATLTIVFEYGMITLVLSDVGATTVVMPVAVGEGGGNRPPDSPTKTWPTNAQFEAVGIGDGFNANVNGTMATPILTAKKPKKK
ncbi:MAG: hypothetical protein FWE62_02290 [Firmicutes bacterium]|nr:hypothetical protein [Bacillota bacterium]